MHESIVSTLKHSHNSLSNTVLSLEQLRQKLDYQIRSSGIPAAVVGVAAPSIGTRFGRQMLAMFCQCTYWSHKIRHMHKTTKIKVIDKTTES